MCDNFAGIYKATKLLAVLWGQISLFNYLIHHSQVQNEVDEVLNHVIIFTPRLC